MRRVGSLTEETDAVRFANHLSTLGLSVRIDKDQEQVLDLWIINEDDFEHAFQLYQTFKSNPQAFANTKLSKSLSDFMGLADLKPKANFEAKKDSRPRYINARDSFAPTSGQLTLAMIIISVLATFLLQGQYDWLRAKLMYSEYRGLGFFEIREGQVWRLVTPIFLHAGGLHLFFNMLWLFQLGTQIEQLEGKLSFVIQVLGYAIFVNTLQYLVSGANFLGMSGVCYALLGYVWMMSLYSRRFSYFIAQGTVGFMLIWMALCFVGIIPNVANAQHIGGFVIGMMTGYTRSGELKLKIKQILRSR